MVRLTNHGITVINILIKLVITVIKQYKIDNRSNPPSNFGGFWYLETLYKENQHILRKNARDPFGQHIKIV